MISQEAIELKELFKQNVVIDIKDLITETSSSRITIFRRLKEIGYITSYNHNGKYYTLPEIVDFDEKGVFEYKGILFYRNGGIQELVIKELDSSEKGYTSEELNAMIGTRVSNQLRLFVNKGLIARRKYSDFYVYYSVDRFIQQKQVFNREKFLNTTSINEEKEIFDENEKLNNNIQDINSKYKELKIKYAEVSEKLDKEIEHAASLEMLILDMDKELGLMDILKKIKAQ